MQNGLIGLVALVAAGLAASSAWGGLTDVGRIHPGEDAPEGILSTLYGGQFQSINGTEDLTNGTVVARRVPDGSLTPPISMPTDQLWSLNDFKTRVVTKFSLFDQTLGIVDGDGDPVELFKASGYGYTATGQGSFNGSVKQARFVRRGETGWQSSVPADNLDERDHLITYRIDGVSTDENVWIMFWEDLSLARIDNPRATASDYNDLAVELRAAAGGVVVPLPAPVWAGIVLTVTAVAAARRAKTRRA